MQTNAVFPAILAGCGQVSAPLMSFVSATFDLVSAEPSDIRHNLVMREQYQYCVA